MRTFLERTNQFLDLPLDLAPRAFLAIAAFVLVPALASPLWNLTMFAPQYPQGLRMSIHSHGLVGGNNGQDLKEINILNHYIGMRELAEADFLEFKWIPFAIGGLGLLFLRAAVLGRLAHVLDCLVLYVYFGGFSLWSFAWKMYSYGHNLGAGAAVKVAPFMPPLFGSKQLANFEVYSYPALGAYALAAAPVLLVLTIVIAWRSGGGVLRTAGQGR